MKNFGKIVVCLVSGLVLGASQYVCSGAASSNPYEPIVTRNVFDLNPPKPIQIKPPEPPSKITPNGIMTIFGTPQVLFKVAIPPHDHKPATEKSYVLSAGQGQDGIEVEHIDDTNNVITFNNHGVVQQIPLVKAGPINTPPVVAGAGNNSPHGAPSFVRHNPGHIPPNIINRLNQLRNQANNNASSDNSGNNNDNLGAGNASYGSGNTQSQKKLTPEEQMIMIAAQHAHAQETGNPIAKIFPPTPLDEAAGVVPQNGSSSSSSSSPPAP